MSWDTFKKTTFILYACINLTSLGSRLLQFLSISKGAQDYPHVRQRKRHRVGYYVKAHREVAAELRNKDFSRPILVS